MEPNDRVNILMVDDNPDNLLALESVLEPLGENLVQASSGRQALSALLQQEFAVILLDVQMPEMDGFETAALILKRDRVAHTPIIFITANGEDEASIVRGYVTGGVDYIASPFNPVFLRSKVAVFTELFKRTQALAMTDELTGLYNRRGFLASARQTLMLCARLEKTAWLLFADMDGLKKINDTLGHVEGDRALIEMARIFRETFRASDVISRWGGDEFAVIAVEISETNPEILIARLQTNVTAFNVAGRHPFNLSISAGVVCCDGFPARSLNELIASADASMYAHKRSKNQAS
jgi:diguanylate cyclase (GGDEF)-like protein